MDPKKNQTKTEGVIKRLIQIFGDNFKELILTMFQNSIFTYEDLIKLGEANILCYDFALLVQYKEKTYGAFYISRIIGEILNIPLQPQKVLRSEDWYDGCIFTKPDSNTKLQLPQNLHEFINKCVEEHGILKVLLETKVVKPSHKLLKCGIISTIDDYKCLESHITYKTKAHTILSLIVYRKITELKKT